MYILDGEVGEEFDEYCDDILADMTGEHEARAIIESGKPEREIEIELFLLAHRQDQVAEAQAEILGYLWTGRRLH